MPEFYEGGQCRYQLAVQPHLAAIARGIRDEHQSRSFILEGTEHALAYSASEPIWREQWIKRDPTNSMKCPFWSNYWYEPCLSCDCRIDASVSMEIDALFFFRNPGAKVLAVHVEMKRPREPLSLGQAEAYRPRAACFRDQRRPRKTLLPHDDFVAVLFCGSGTNIPLMKTYFDRVILHEEAREAFPAYPGS